MIKIIVIGLLAFFLYFLQRKIYCRLWNRGLLVNVMFTNNTMFEGEKAELLEVIENRKRLPLPMLKVKFQTDRNLEFADTEGSSVTDQYYRNDVFQVGSGEKITRKLTFTGKRRGYYKINGIDLVAADLFLSVHMMDNKVADQYIYVYPKPYNSREFGLFLQQLSGEVLAKRHWVEDPFEYRGIREYQPYDDIRNVNWKATAKTEDLKVNQKNYTSIKTIRIFLNLDDSGVLKKTECVETSIQIAAGLADFFLAQGIRVACYANGTDLISKDPVFVEAGAGRGQLDRIYRALARINGHGETVSFPDYLGQKLFHEARGCMTFLVSPNHYPDFMELILEYQGSGEDFIWFYPVRDKQEPEISGEIKSHVRVIHLRD